MPNNYLATGGMGVSSRYGAKPTDPAAFTRGTPQYRQAIAALRDWQGNQIRQGASLDQLGIYPQKERGLSFYNEVQQGGPQAFGPRGDWIAANEGFRNGANPFAGYQPDFSGGMGGQSPNFGIPSPIQSAPLAKTAPPPGYDDVSSNAMLIRRGNLPAGGAPSLGGRSPQPSPYETEFGGPRRRRGMSIRDMLGEPTTDSYLHRPRG